MKGLEYVIYTVLPLWLYLMFASPGRTAFPSLIWTYSLVILIARLVMPIWCRLKKTGPAVFSSVIYDMY